MCYARDVKALFWTLLDKVKNRLRGQKSVVEYLCYITV